MGLKKDYYGLCVTCNYCNHMRTKGNKCYCDVHNNYYTLIDSCNSGFFTRGYQENRSLSDNDIKYIFKKLGYKFYISTSVITTLMINTESQEQKKEYEHVLNSLIEFKDNVLDINPKYQEFLNQYNVDGELTSQLFDNDINKLSIAYGIYNNYLLPCYKLFKNNDNDTAIDLYINMCETLYTYYNIEAIKIDNNLQRKRKSE